MRRILIILFGIVLITGVIATGVILQNADFIVPEKDEIRQEGCITFLADGNEAECCLNEPNLDIDDDFEECLERNYAGMRITNAVDWTGREYKENPKTGERFFE